MHSSVHSECTLPHEREARDSAPAHPYLPTREPTFSLTGTHSECTLAHEHPVTESGLAR